MYLFQFSAWHFSKAIIKAKSHVSGSKEKAFQINETCLRFKQKKLQNCMILY
jgi:hypothetical protein